MILNISHHVKNTLGHTATSFHIYLCRKLEVKQGAVSCVNNALLQGFSSRSTSCTPSEYTVFDGGLRVWRLYTRPTLSVRSVHLLLIRQGAQILHWEIISGNNDSPWGLYRQFFFLMITTFWAKNMEVNVHISKCVLETSRRMCLPVCVYV